MLNVLTGNFLDRGAQTLANCLSEFSGETVGAVINKPQCPRLKFAECLEEMENDTDETFLGNLENGATIGYMSDLGNSPQVPHGEVLRRVYDDHGSF